MSTDEDIKEANIQLIKSYRRSIKRLTEEIEKYEAKIQKVQADTLEINRKINSQDNKTSRESRARK